MADSNQPQASKMRVRNGRGEAPLGAFAFAAETNTPDLSETDNGKRKFTGIAYSGKAITGHWYWGTVVFDLASTTAKDKTGVLENHDPDKRVGVAKLAIDGNSIRVDEGTLFANDRGAAIAQESDDGFPWEMSVYNEPGSIERIKPGHSVKVNGHEVHGPAYVFRNGRIREVSFTPTGADPFTEARAMSARVPVTFDTDEDHDMELEELKQQVADLQTKFTDSEKARDEAVKRADEAEAKLAEQAQTFRKKAVEKLFSDLGRDAKEDAIKPYLNMPQEQFDAVAKDLRAAQPQAPESLFSHQAEHGEDDEAGATGQHKFTKGEDTAAIDRMSAL